MLLKRFPGKEITEVFDIAFGRVIGFILSGIIALYMLFTAITQLSEFNEVMRVYVFPLSPNWYIIGFFVVGVFVVSRLGLESIARFAKLSVYIMLIGFTIVLLLGLQNYNINNIYPIFGNGLGTTILTGIARSSVYGEVIILAIFANSLQGVKYIKKEGILGIIFSALTISVSIFTFTLTFPYFTAQEIVAPMYEMATLIDYGRFLQRVEPIFLFNWTISAMISTTVIFYAFIWMFCKIFRIEDKKPVILGGSVVLYAAAIMHKDIISVISGGVQFVRSFGSLFIFGLPLLALITVAIRKKGATQNA
jgi:spore germination protein (amino acid permease)